MNKYNRDKIDKLIQPLMTMMQEEFPNSCKLIIEPYYSKIVYEHDEMIFPSDEMKKPLGETKFSEGIDNFMRTVFSVAKQNIENVQGKTSRKKAPIDKTN